MIRKLRLKDFGERSEVHRIMVNLINGSGLLEHKFEKEKALKSGQTGLSTKVSGKTTKQTGKAD